MNNTVALYDQGVYTGKNEKFLYATSYYKLKSLATIEAEHNGNFKDAEPIKPVDEGDHDFNSFLMFCKVLGATGFIIWFIIRCKICCNEPLPVESLQTQSRNFR